MAEIIEQEGKQKGGKKKAKKHSVHIDMTPMVDLMCLLITFFMLTTVFSRAKVMEITMPEKKDANDKTDAPKISADRTMNILITGEDKIYYYYGLADAKKLPLPQLIETNYSKDGIRKILIEKNKNVYDAVKDLKTKVEKGQLKLSDSALNAQIKQIKKDDKTSPIVLIKSDDKAKYKNFVDIIDEMAISNIANYAPVDMDPIEKQMIATYKK